LKISGKLPLYQILYSVIHSFIHYYFKLYSLSVYNNNNIINTNMTWFLQGENAHLLPIMAAGAGANLPFYQAKLLLCIFVTTKFSPLVEFAGITRADCNR
jgi:hypothetical protein